MSLPLSRDDAATNASTSPRPSLQRRGTERHWIPDQVGDDRKRKSGFEKQIPRFARNDHSGVVWSVPVSGYATLIRPTVFWIPGFQFAESCEQVRVFQLVLEIGQDVPG